VIGSFRISFSIILQGARLVAQGLLREDIFHLFLSRL